MSRSVVLALDQGTTNTKVVAVDRAGRIVARHSERVGIAYPRPGWVESDPLDIWRTVFAAIGTVVDTVGAGEIAAIGVSNQRESVTAWDPTTGEPLGPVVSWQCTRGAELCRQLASPEADGLVARTTGLSLDPMFSASKMRWLLDHVDDGPQRAADGRLVIGTVDAWLLWNLTAGTEVATDLTNASRTALCDLRTGTWSAPLLDLFGIPAAALPRIRPSADSFGECRVAGVDAGRASGVTIGALIGDSHAALVGHGAFFPGAVKASFGTGTSVMAPVADPDVRPAELSMTVAWSIAAEPAPRVVHAIEGNIYATGAALEWTAGLLGVPVDGLDRLAASVGDTAGVTFVPAFSGLGAPHWDPTARGTILGLTRGGGPGHLARAAFESVAHQVADVIDAAAPALGGGPLLLHTDGGAMRSDLLATTVADLTGATLRRSEEPDVAAIGAALLAGLAAGCWSGIDELAALPRAASEVRPTIGQDERVARRHRWADAVQRTSGQAGGSGEMANDR